ncbi:putative tetratricopeptide repeat protein ovary overexpressed [Balamuthia mandrillaris]
MEVHPFHIKSQRVAFPSQRQRATSTQRPHSTQQPVPVVHGLNALQRFAERSKLHAKQQHEKRKKRAREEDAPTHEQESRRLKEEGSALAERGDFRAALTKWDSALRLMPGQAVLHEMRAQVLLELGYTLRAVDAAMQATTLDPHWAEGFVTLGRAHLNDGDISLAVESFEQALRLAPLNAEATEDLDRARGLLEQKKEIDARRERFLQRFNKQQLGRAEGDDEELSSSLGLAMEQPESSESRVTRRKRRQLRGRRKNTCGKTQTEEPVVVYTHVLKEGSNAFLEEVEEWERSTVSSSALEHLTWKNQSEAELPKIEEIQEEEAQDMKPKHMKRGKTNQGAT